MEDIEGCVEGAVNDVLVTKNVLKLEFNVQSN